MQQNRSILVIGSTDVTIAVLEAARSAELDIAAVVSSSPEFNISYSSAPVRNYRAAGVEAWCDGAGVPHHRFTTNEALNLLLADLQPAIGLVAGWYHMVPTRVRASCRLGCIGLHASLLPRLRGGAPLNWAILLGHEECGVSLFELTDGMDDGRLYAQCRRAIDDSTTIGQLVAWSRVACAELTSKCVPQILDGTLCPVEQVGAVSYGLQRSPQDGAIQWRQTVAQIDRLIRAVGKPYPGAYSHLEGSKITIWSAKPLDAAPLVAGAPGQLFRMPGSAEVCVVTGRGLLQILEAGLETGEDALDRLARSSQRRFSEVGQ